MVVESNNASTNASLNDWLKNLVPVFQPMRKEKSKLLAPRDSRSFPILWASYG